MKVNIQVVFTELDKEWLDLILEAKKMGMDVEEIRKFLKRPPHHERRQEPINKIENT